MTSTLKEQYKGKQIKQLQEKLSQVDTKVINEIKRSIQQDKLILEAFDKQQMAAAIDVVKKLKALNFGALTSLSQARDAAVTDVTRVLAGGGDVGIIRKIVNMFKSEKENPLVDVLAFANATQNFFAQFSQYVTALAAGNDDQTLGSVVTGKSSDELEDLNAVSGLGTPEKKKLGDLQKVIVNGFKPQGALANIGKNWIDKYLKGRKGMQSLAKDMLKMSVKDLKSISTNVATSMKNVEAVGQAAAGAAQQASVGTTGSTGSNVSSSSQASTGTAGTKSGAKAPGAQVPAGSKGDKIFNDLKSDGVDKKFGIKPNVLRSIIAAMERKDLFK